MLSHCNRPVRNAIVLSLISLSILAIAFPAFGTGVGGFALSDCARIMIEAISAHAATPTSLHRVRLVLFGQPAYDTFVAVAREILGHGQDAA